MNRYGNICLYSNEHMHESYKRCYITSTNIHKYIYGLTIHSYQHKYIHKNKYPNTYMLRIEK